MDANDILADTSVRHAVNLNRYSKHLERQTVRQIKKARKELDRQLIKRVGDLSKLDQAKFLEGRSYTTKRLKAMRDSFKRYESDYVEVLSKPLTKELVELSKTESDLAVKQLDKAVPIVHDFVNPTQTQLLNVVKRRPFQGKLLKEATKKWSKDRRREVQDAVRLGLSLNETVPQIAKRIVDVGETSERWAASLAITAASHVSNQTRLETFKKNSDVLVGYQWVATLDTRTSPICRARDNKVYKLDSGIVPPAHIRCRSTITPLTRAAYAREQRKAGNAGTRASMTGQVPADLNYTDWLEKQPKKIKIASLGVERYMRLERGENQVADFINIRDEKLYTLKELARRTSESFLEPVLSKAAASRGVSPRDYLPPPNGTPKPPNLPAEGFLAVAEPVQTRLEVAAADILEEVSGAEFKSPGLKKLDSLQRKLDLKKARANELKDIVRAGFVVDSPGVADEITLLLSEFFYIEDEGWQTTEAGYFDRKLVLTDRQTGIRAEVQFWEPNLLAAKSKGHKLYEKYRELEPNTDEAKALNQQMVELYGDALSKADRSWRRVLPDSDDVVPVGFVTLATDQPDRFKLYEEQRRKKQEERDRRQKERDAKRAEEAEKEKIEYERLSEIFGEKGRAGNPKDLREFEKYFPVGDGHGQKMAEAISQMGDIRLWHQGQYSEAHHGWYDGDSVIQYGTYNFGTQSEHPEATGSVFRHEYGHAMDSPFEGAAESYRYSADVKKDKNALLAGDKINLESISDDKLSLVLDKPGKEVIAEIRDHAENGRVRELISSMRDALDPNASEENKDIRKWEAFRRVADAVSAATDDELGFGHGKDYYRRAHFNDFSGIESGEDTENPDINWGHTTELFANYISIMGDSRDEESRAWQEIFRLMVPESSAAFDELMFNVFSVEL